MRRQLNGTTVDLWDMEMEDKLHLLRKIRRSSSYDSGNSFVRNQRDSALGQTRGAGGSARAEVSLTLLMDIIREVNC